MTTRTLSFCDQSEVFHCDEDNIQCVPMSAKCDGYTHCDNHVDEMVVTCGCLPSEFQCNSTTCISKTLRCDTKNDCDNGSDEKNCKAYVCPISHIKCDNHFCYPRDKQCNFIDDCGDNSDEKNCKRVACLATQFTCNNSECIESTLICDGHYDCIDHSDEDDQACAPDKYYRCSAGYYIKREFVCDGLFDDCIFTHEDETNCGFCGIGLFECPEGKCIKKSNVCDGYCDCLGCADEDNCVSSTFGCPRDTRFICRPDIHHNGTRCISREYLCDKKNDCMDTTRGQDESSCVNGTAGCQKPGFFFCPIEKRCLENTMRCNHYPECYDGSDEYGCPAPASCPVGLYMCQNGDCISMSKRCDAVHDCTDWSDELNCENYTCPHGKRNCDSGHCLPEKFWCDFYRDCPDGSDEKYCQPPSCREDEFQCKNGQCINSSLICYQDSNRLGCSDNSHLLNCSDHACSEDQFKCRNSYCISNLKVCDVYIDCKHGHWDERNCYFKCPFVTEECFCMGSTMFCNQTGLRKIPLPQSTEDLTKLYVNIIGIYLVFHSRNLAGNNLTVLRNGSFFGLTQLVQLDLSSQRLTHLYKNMFKGLKEVTVLDLTHNVIKDIGESVFMGLPTLSELKTDSFTFCCLAPEGVECSPKQDEFSSCEDLMSNHVLRISIWVLGSIAIIGNFVVIIWRVRDFRGGKVHSFLITNLAIGDFLMGLYMLIIAVADSLYRGVYVAYADIWKQSGFCQFAGFVSTFSSELSVLTLTTITLDRLVCILFPLRRARLGLKQASIVMCFMWILVFVLASLPLLGFGYFENFYGRSGVCLALHVTPDKRPGWEYSVGVFIVMNFTSFLLIASSYLWMFSVAKKTRSAVRSAESKTDSAMARRMTLIVMTDFCCWIPIIILGFVSLAGTRADDQVYAWIAVFVLPLNSAMNPVIYTLSTAPFLGNLRKRANRFRKSFIHSFTTDTKHSYVDDATTHSYCEKKSSYRQLELKRLRSLNNSPPMYYNMDPQSDS
ncbi:hypothetical protein Btru_009916 [Bulinus truncatus]|nr:hypothetical protein Btru_009916 [Bulinus truncatus]